MLIEVKVSKFVRKYIQYKNPKQLKLQRTNLFAMLFFAQAKFRDNGKIWNPKKKIVLNDTITIELSEAQWKKQCLKTELQIFHYSAYNKIIRNFFYEDFFTFMDLRLLKKELLQEDDTLIKELTFEFMRKIDLSDEDISYETLLRNYRRYRNSQYCDLYELLDQLDDD